MTEFLKYKKIAHFGKIKHDQEDECGATEKIDGANLSVQTVDGKLQSRSRNNILTKELNLSGAYEFIQNLKITDKQLEYLTDKIMYGEWTIPHQVKYDRKFNNRFYVFEIYDIKTDKFLPWNDVVTFATSLKLPTPRLFASGKYKDIIDICKSIGGMSDMTNELNNGEGIIFFNQTKNTKEKIVAKDFSELKNNTIHDYKSKTNKFTLEITKNLVEKTIHKLLDEGILKQETMTIKNLKNIVNVIEPVILNDINQELSITITDPMTIKYNTSVIFKFIKDFITK